MSAKTLQIHLTRFRRFATHLFKAPGAFPSQRTQKTALQKFGRRNAGAVEVVRGDLKTQGYVEFSLAVNLCQLFGLSMIAENLLKLTSTYNPDGQSLIVARDNLAPNGKNPATAVQQEGIPTQLRPVNSVNWGEMNNSEIDELLQIARPSFKFMTPEQPSQSSHLALDYLQNAGRMEKPDEWKSQINLSSMNIICQDRDNGRPAFHTYQRPIGSRWRRRCRLEDRAAIRNPGWFFNRRLG
ncbi:hypothetical protein LTR41_011331 [Exophiala xenobiotica]|nr:hypothetical protein LTR41_011331 [Exophiala xenobiotica]KAK5550735.1 hypothetical protein LTR46_011262 [Exophiala xenobiotica]